MLIEQLPTSSSSSSASTDGGDRRTSSPAHKENPSPSSQPPPQTSAAAPLPEVDEEAIRRLDRILWSMPSEMDTATVYATLKARLGISLSRDQPTTSTPRNPPRNPPLFSQPAATPVAEAESVPPPHAEGTAAPHTPSPTSGGGSNSPCQGPPQLIKVVNIDDDSTEDFLPPPNEILQQREAEWTFIPTIEDESVPEREEEPLHRRTRRVHVERMIEEVEARRATLMMGEEEPEQRPRVVRRLIDEPEEVNQGVGEAVEERGAGEAREEREVVEDSQLRAEREEGEECSSSSEEDAPRNPGRCYC